MKKGPALAPLAPAHLAGLAAFQAAAVLALFDVRLAAIPLALFLILCCAAPFFPRFGFYLPIVSSGRKDRSAVALTFDDGPDPATTPLLLDLLSAAGVTATFFTTGVRTAAHPGLVREIISRGHSIGNHSWSHSPFLMLMGTGRLRNEIVAAQSQLAGFGIRSLAFRPPVGITNPRLWRVLLEAGLYCVNFSCRARDAGNRRISGLSGKILKRARSGDIILLHDVAPGPGFDSGRWIREIEAILNGLKQRGLAVIPLADLIRRPVMAPPAGVSAGPVASFYDAIAGYYDSERSAARQTPAFAGELKLFENNYLPLLSPGHRVLEVGAGTGTYTIRLARYCRDVTAVEISGSMLAVLKQKAAREGLSNIIPKNNDIADSVPDGCFDSICSFSSFEYIQDLGALIDQLAARLQPGGTLYFTTSRTSLFRFFTQVGNAMRQGLWLHGRTVRGTRAMLESAGFREVRVSSHVMKCGPIGGILLEAIAVKNRG